MKKACLICIMGLGLLTRLSRARKLIDKNFESSAVFVGQKKRGQSLPASQRSDKKLDLANI